MPFPPSATFFPNNGTEHCVPLKPFLSPLFPSSNKALSDPLSCRFFLLTRISAFKFQNYKNTITTPTPTPSLRCFENTYIYLDLQVGKLVAMGTTKTPQKTAIPQILKLDKGMKLAEQWVNNMTKAAEGEPTEVELEGRPSRVGLGAKISRQPTLGPSNDPIEMKLRAKLGAAKRKAAKSYKESTRSATDGYDNDDDDEEELGSRTTAFDKKRAAVSNTAILQAKKKQK